jgi:hypothetical protein
MVERASASVKETSREMIAHSACLAYMEIYARYRATAMDLAILEQGSVFVRSLLRGRTARIASLDISDQNVTSCTLTKVLNASRYLARQASVQGMLSAWQIRTSMRPGRVQTHAAGRQLAQRVAGANSTAHATVSWELLENPVIRVKAGDMGKAVMLSAHEQKLVLVQVFVLPLGLANATSRIPVRIAKAVKATHTALDAI